MAANYGPLADTWLKGVDDLSEPRYGLSETDNFPQSVAPCNCSRSLLLGTALSAQRLRAT